MKSALKKLIVIGAILAVIGVFALVDFIIMSTYQIDFVSVERIDNGETEYEDVPLDCGIADGKSYVRFKIKLTQGGKPVEGHTLYIKTNRNILSRMITDENGEVIIDYKCYLANSASSVTPIVLTVRDESNSLFIFIPSEESYTLQMVAKKSEGASSMTTNDIFYDIEEKEDED